MLGSRPCTELPTTLCPGSGCLCRYRCEFVGGATVIRHRTAWRCIYIPHRPMRAIRMQGTQESVIPATRSSAYPPEDFLTSGTALPLTNYGLLHWSLDFRLSDLQSTENDRLLELFSSVNHFSGGKDPISYLSCGSSKRESSPELMARPAQLLMEHQGAVSDFFRKYQR